jgi:hydrogenase nickel incorporation protein HypA/HybF
VHEFSIAEALAAQVQRHAPAGAISGSTRISEVEIRVGPLRGLEPDALRMCWEAVTFGTPIEGSVLRVESLSWTISCQACGRRWDSPVPFVPCTCGEPNPTPSGGDELELVALVIDEEEVVAEVTA